MYTNSTNVSTKKFILDFPTLRVELTSKRPAEVHGIYDAVFGNSIDLTRYNAGVRCGGGLLVVDVDPRNGGLGSYGNLSQAYGDLTHGCSCVVDTPSGGFHLYFLYDASLWSVKKSSSVLGVGIDVLGEGCCAVIPPSSYCGVAYGFRDEEEYAREGISEAPTWLLGLVGVRMGAEGRAEGAMAFSAKVAGEAGLGLEDGLEVGLEDTATTLEEAEVVLGRIAPDCGRDDWLRVGMGLKHTSGLGDTQVGRNTWVRWSKGDFHKTKAKKFNAADCIRVWNSIKGGAGYGKPVTWASVVKMSLSLNSIKDLNMNTNSARQLKESSVPVLPTHTEESDKQINPQKESMDSNKTNAISLLQGDSVSPIPPKPPKEEAKMTQGGTVTKIPQGGTLTKIPQGGTLTKLNLARLSDVSTKSLHPYYSQTAEGKVRTAMLPKFIEKLKTKRLLIDVMAHIPNPIDDGTMFLYPFPDNIVVAFLGGKEVILSVDDNLQILRELTEKDLVNKLAVYMQESCERRDLVDDTNDIRVRRKLVEHFVSGLNPIETPVIPYVAPGYPKQLCIHYSSLVPSDGPTPAWDELLKGIKTQKMRNQLMAFIAILLLYPDTKLLQYVLMTGTGGLGKSSVLIAVKEWLGKAAGTFRIAETRFGISAILNKRLVYLDEISDFKFLESDIFKSCTGSLKAQVSLEEKFGKAFDFNPKYTMWMLATNQIPNIKQDDANMRRIIPIEFARPRNGIPIKRIPNMEQTLIDEMPHFVWKCDQVLKQNPVKDGMIQSIEDSTTSINSMNADLITSQLGLTPNPLSKVPTSEISSACKALGMTNIQIGAIMKQLASTPSCYLKMIKGTRFLVGFQKNEDA